VVERAASTPTPAAAQSVRLAHFSLKAAPGDATEWGRATQAQVRNAHGLTQVWRLAPLPGGARLKGTMRGAAPRVYNRKPVAAHFNKKPFEMRAASARPRKKAARVIWETVPFVRASRPLPYARLQARRFPCASPATGSRTSPKIAAAAPRMTPSQAALVPRRTPERRHGDPGDTGATEATEAPAPVMPRLKVSNVTRRSPTKPVMRLLPDGVLCAAPARYLHLILGPSVGHGSRHESSYPPRG